MNKPLIMIIDDCTITLDVTRIHLETAGFKVITRSQSIGTTAEIMSIRPDCVLLDVSMPGLPGTVVAKIARQNKIDTKIVLFSAKEESELRELVNDCGADGYIKKTDNSSELISRVKSFLSQ